MNGIYYQTERCLKIDYCYCNYHTCDVFYENAAHNKAEKDY